MEILNNLKDIKQILTQSFESSYEQCDDKNTIDPKLPLNPQRSDNKSFECDNSLRNIESACRTSYYLSSIPIFPSSSTTIINNYNTHKKDDKDEKKEVRVTTVSNNSLILGGLVVAGFSAGSTYLMSKDEYIIFYYSEIIEKIDLLKDHLRYGAVGLPTLQKNKNYRTNIENILRNYDKWNTLFEKRTKKVCASKVIGSCGVISGIAGIVFSSTVILSGGIMGGTASGCYLLWKYLMKNTKKERQHYDAMINSIDELIKLLETELSIPTYNDNFGNPSAPPPPAYEDVNKEE